MSGEKGWAGTPGRGAGAGAGAGFGPGAGAWGVDDQEQEDPRVHLQVIEQTLEAILAIAQQIIQTSDTIKAITGEAAQTTAEQSAHEILSELGDFHDKVSGILESAAPGELYTGEYITRFLSTISPESGAFEAHPAIDSTRLALSNPLWSVEGGKKIELEMGKTHFIPYNIDIKGAKHWVLLAVDDKQIAYIDPLGNALTARQQDQIRTVLSRVTDSNFDNVQIIENQSRFQYDGVSCGALICKAAEIIVTNGGLPESSEDLSACLTSDREIAKVLGLVKATKSLSREALDTMMIRDGLATTKDAATERKSYIDGKLFPRYSQIFGEKLRKIQNEEVIRTVDREWGAYSGVPNMLIQTLRMVEDELALQMQISHTKGVTATLEKSLASVSGSTVSHATAAQGLGASAAARAVTPRRGIAAAAQRAMLPPAPPLPATTVTAAQEAAGSKESKQTVRTAAPSSRTAAAPAPTSANPPLPSPSPALAARKTIRGASALPLHGSGMPASSTATPAKRSATPTRLAGRGSKVMLEQAAPTTPVRRFTDYPLPRTGTPTPYAHTTPAGRGRSSDRPEFNSAVQRAAHAVPGLEILSARSSVDSIFSQETFALMDLEVTYFDSGEKVKLWAFAHDVSSIPDPIPLLQKQNEVIKQTLADTENVRPFILGDSRDDGKTTTYVWYHPDTHQDDPNPPAIIYIVDNATNKMTVERHGQMPSETLIFQPAKIENDPAIGAQLICIPTQGDAELIGDRRNSITKYNQILPEPGVPALPGHTPRGHVR